MITHYNFCAGPAMLPRAVMEQANQEFLNWEQQGCSIMELSHRSAAFIGVAKQAEQDFRQLLSIPDNYKVLFCHGGGRGQFSAVPLNLSEPSQTADYLVSGSWSKGAVDEARKYVNVNVVATNTSDPSGLISTPQQDAWRLSDNPAYFHYCPNETVDGLEINAVPDLHETPVVADMSSNILSKPIEVGRFGVIYAGAQKNIGPSGMSVVIVRDDLLNAYRPMTPSILNYSLLAENNSMYNTPPTFAWYLAGLVFKWLIKQGGVKAMQRLNEKKSSLLYEAIDCDDFYINCIAPGNRSRMNVPFQLANPELDGAFLSEAKDAGLHALKGHRSVGGMRASIYNAMPIEGVQTLVEFMQYFSKRYG